MIKYMQMAMHAPSNYKNEDDPNAAIHHQSEKYQRYKQTEIQLILEMATHLHLQRERRCPGPGKEAWPELVGQNAGLATQIIERENPKVRAIVVTQGRHLVTQDFRCDRVWVWSSAGVDGVVVVTPIIG